MKYGATGGVLIVQVIYSILHAVHWNLRCSDGSSDIQYTAFFSVQLAVYWCFMWYRDYCVQYNAPGSVLMVQEIYKLLHAVHCNWRCNNVSSYVQITACNTVQLTVYWFFKWFTVYCMQNIVTGGVLMVQVIYRLLHAVRCNCRWIVGSSDIQFYCMQYSATGGVLMVQVMYRLLHAV